jgi:DNA-binding Lrp family transcriptional regulator
MGADENQDQASWTLLTAHGRALVAIAQDPDARMRDLAEIIGVTERTVQAIVADLEAAGYLTHTRVGRRNRYTVGLDQPFRHSAQDGHLVGPLLDVLAHHPTDINQDAERGSGPHNLTTDSDEHS